jgi:hypothetical protein
MKMKTAEIKTKTAKMKTKTKTTEMTTDEIMRRRQDNDEMTR